MKYDLSPWLQDNKYCNELAEKIDKYNLTDLLIDCWMNRVIELDDVVERITDYFAENDVELLECLNPGAGAFSWDVWEAYLEQKYGIVFREYRCNLMQKPPFVKYDKRDFMDRYLDIFMRNDKDELQTN